METDTHKEVPGTATVKTMEEVMRWSYLLKEVQDLDNRKAAYEKALEAGRMRTDLTDALVSVTAPAYIAALESQVRYEREMARRTLHELLNQRDRNLDLFMKANKHKRRWRYYGNDRHRMAIEMMGEREDAIEEGRELRKKLASAREQITRLRKKWYPEKPTPKEK